MQYLLTQKSVGKNTKKNTKKKAIIIRSEQLWTFEFEMRSHEPQVMWAQKANC